MAEGKEDPPERRRRRGSRGEGATKADGARKASGRACPLEVASTTGEKGSG